jgi:hypothetical protein
MIKDVDRDTDLEWDDGFDPPEVPVGVSEEARVAGDDAVEALAKVTAQMDSGEQRPEQQEMCRAVAEALVTGTHLVVQAGTGTGKSLAYLVPAVLSGKKVVVATATKALQDQLAGKDLPLVEVGLGSIFSYAVLKGRSNYICLQRVGEVGNGGIQPELGADPGGGDGGRRGRGSGRQRVVRGLRRELGIGGAGPRRAGRRGQDPVDLVVYVDDG